MLPFTPMNSTTSNETFLHSVYDPMQVDDFANMSLLENTTTITMSSYSLGETCFLGFPVRQNSLDCNQDLLLDLFSDYNATDVHKFGHMGGDNDEDSKNCLSDSDSISEASISTCSSSDNDSGCCRMLGDQTSDFSDHGSSLPSTPPDSPCNSKHFVTKPRQNISRVGKPGCQKKSKNAAKNSCRKLSKASSCLSSSQSDDPGESSNSIPTQKQYTCGVCVFRTPWRSNLARHKRKHTGEKPYACKHCSYTFANSSNRKKHELSCKQSEEVMAKKNAKISAKLAAKSQKSKAGRKRANAQ